MANVVIPAFNTTHGKALRDAIRQVPRGNFVGPQGGELVLCLNGKPILTLWG